MALSNAEIAQAFSGHRFEEAFDRLADEVTWRLVGESTLQGRDVVVAACRDTAEALAQTATTWPRFVSAGYEDVVAVDVIARYENAEGTSVVSSCDIYEFDGATIRAITSYTVEIGQDGSDQPS